MKLNTVLIIAIIAFSCATKSLRKPKTKKKGLISRIKSLFKSKKANSKEESTESYEDLAPLTGEDLKNFRKHVKKELKAAIYKIKETKSCANDSSEAIMQVSRGYKRLNEKCKENKHSKEVFE